MAAATTVRRFRIPLGQRIFALAAAIILVSVTGLFVAIAALSFIVRDQTTAWTFGLIGYGGGAIMTALSLYVLRDVAGRASSGGVAPDRSRNPDIGDAP